MIVLWTVEDEGLEDEAREELMEERSALGVPEEMVVARAWAKGYESVGRMSAARFVRGARDFRALGVGGVGSSDSEEEEEGSGREEEEDGRGARRGRRKRVQSAKARGAR